jgi:hypothetical protein
MSKKQLQDLHTKLATVLADAIEAGVPVKDETSGAVHKAPAPTAILNVARQFLKDNGIEAIPVPGSPTGRLTEALPFAGTSEYDNVEDHQTH